MCRRLIDQRPLETVEQPEIGRAIMARARPELVENRFQLLEPDGLFQRPDHVETQRLTEAEGAFEHPAVEAR